MKTNILSLFRLSLLLFFLFANGNIFPQSGLCSTPTGCNIINNSDFNPNSSYVSKEQNPFRLGHVPCWDAGSLDPHLDNGAPISGDYAVMWSGWYTPSNYASSESIITNINVQKGKMYYLTYDLMVQSGIVHNVNIYLTNSSTSGLPNAYNNGTNYALPNPSQKQRIDYLANYQNGNWVNRKVCFTVNDDLNQLWICPTQNNNNIWAWLAVDRVKIEFLGDAGSNKTICPGRNVVIGSTPCLLTGVTYSWSPSAGLNCTNCATPTASPNTTTTYILTVTAPNGCTQTDNVTVTVSPTANAGPDKSICGIPNATNNYVVIGNTVSCGRGNPTSYSWAPSTNLSCPSCCATNAYPQVTTVYTVTTTDQVTGCTASDAVLVTVTSCCSTTPVISASSNAICPGTSSVILTISQYSSGAIQWQKQECNGSFTNIPGGTSLIITSGNTVGTYYRAVVICGDTYRYSNTVLIYQFPSSCSGPIEGCVQIGPGIAKQKNSGIDENISSANIFPNPFNSNFTAIYDGEGQVKIEVMDVLGKVLITQLGVAKEEIKLEMKDAPTGVYIIKFTAEGNTTMKKIMKQ
ncbi:MAG: T9SS type A sorting domain-containing protein [Bacteroidetes bacterium]|nr:T9SS type A sorting domain-containing protein [Bacteroidota bacterium]